MSKLPKEIGDDTILSAVQVPVIAFDSSGYLLENQFSAEHLNAIARYAFLGSRALFKLRKDLKDSGEEEITFTSEELFRLGDHLEEIAFRLGDGCLRENAPKDPAPKRRKPRSKFDWQKIRKGLS
jgi:hypothetical protein